MSTMELRDRFSQMTEKTDFFGSIQHITERFLSRRRRIRRIKRERQKAKNPILDWIEAFLWAAGVVLLINQYLFQAYQIPSGSMIDTLLIGDRIFVNKLIYGPELLPGIGKLPSPIKPERNDVIIFENPSYISQGPLFDIAQRVIYMLTLSLIDIDRDENGAPKAHFLIKRAVGMGGDHIKSDKGELSILFDGETRWVPERDYIAEAAMDHTVARLMKESDYQTLEAAARALAYENMHLPVPDYLASMVPQNPGIQYPDYIAYEKARLSVIRAAQPHVRRYAEQSAQFNQGWYIPEGRILPLGDNRDNSRDGRYFGPVNEDKILGKGAIIYWPLTRFGIIK